MFVKKIIIFFSGFLKAKQNILDENFGEIIECCSNELANPLTSYKAESLLLRGTMYQLRGEGALAMTDFSDLINLNDAPMKVVIIFFRSCIRNNENFIAKIISVN